MASRINHLIKENLINPPTWMKDNIFYEVMMGSVAYGCNEENSSDKDIYAICIPPKDVIFPHLNGYIFGFGSQPKRFDNFQQHKIHDQTVEYDIDCYNIVRFFHLCMDANPNIVDTLFVPQRCVLWMTKIGQKIRDNRKMFLSKKAYHKFRGHAFAQLHAIATKIPAIGSKRRILYDKFGFDTKYAYHVIRLCCECEQILTTGDIVLDRDREVYKSIRRGEWTLDRIKDVFDIQEHHLSKWYESSSAVPFAPDEKAIRNLLIECLEMHYKDIPVRKDVSRTLLMDKVMEVYELVRSIPDGNSTQPESPTE